MLNLLISAVAVAITFGIVIFVHELGHFIACRWLKMRVEAFAFGFGKELYGFTRESTRYSIRAIPLGGYVKVAGEEIGKSTGTEGEYFSKPWYQRIVMALAGPVMNYLLAFIIFSALVFFVGVPVPSDKPVIGSLAENYPAQSAGLKEGDTITAIAGVKVKAWGDVASIIHGIGEKNFKLNYVREGKEFSAALKAVKDPSGEFSVIGISPSVQYQRAGFLGSFVLGAKQCYFWTAYSVKMLAVKIYKKEKPDVAGPIGIVHIVSKAAQTGFVNLVHLIALISVAVGMFNLFPIPVLDGGQIMLFLWEGVSRKKLTEKLVSITNAMGIAVLLFIFLFATYSDIIRLTAK